jgi:hypothetical protein
MLIDALVSFIPPGSPLLLVAGDGVGIRSSIIDLLGSGAGTAPQNIIGNAALFGMDVGIGDPRPQIEVLVSTAFTTGNAATLNVMFQAAADLGTPTYQPDTWHTLVETGPIAVANLNAIGDILARFDYPPVFPINLRPRYLSLLFQPLTGTHFTAGAVLAPTTMVRDDQSNKNTPANYSVGAP